MLHSKESCMGIISREEMERRLADPLNLLVMRESLSLRSSQNPIKPGSPVPVETPNLEVEQKEVIEHKRSGPGRTKGTLNRTDEDRLAIGELATLVGCNKAAELTGSSNSQAHSYAHGFNTSGHRNPNAALGEAVENSIEAVKERAIAKILECMEVISKEKLDVMSPLAASQVAVNLSKVSPNLENKVPGGINTTNQATVVIYSPPVSEESRYKTIKVS
jgi:hypothetical protein